MTFDYDKSRSDTVRHMLQMRGHEIIMRDKQKAKQEMKELKEMVKGQGVDLRSLQDEVMNTERSDKRDPKHLQDMMDSVFDVGGKDTRANRMQNKLRQKLTERKIAEYDDGDFHVLWRRQTLD